MVKVHLSLDEDLLQEIRRQAAELHTTAPRLIAALVRRRMAQQASRMAAGRADDDPDEGSGKGGAT